MQSPYPPPCVFWSIHKTVISNQRPDLNFQKFMLSISLLIRRNKIAQPNKIKNDFSWSTKRTTAHWWCIYDPVLFGLVWVNDDFSSQERMKRCHHKTPPILLGVHYSTAMAPRVLLISPKLVHKTILLFELERKACWLSLSSCQSLYFFGCASITLQGRHKKYLSPPSYHQKKTTMWQFGWLISNWHANANTSPTPMYIQRSVLCSTNPLLTMTAMMIAVNE